MAGYSGTPLAKTLGIKAGYRVWAKDAPPGYRKSMSPLPDEVQFLEKPGKDLDLIHYFTKSERRLTAILPSLMRRIQRDGTIWISWPKKISRVPTDITEDVVRRAALALGLVDVKVCAVDDIWSGLKLVIRKNLR